MPTTGGAIEGMSGLISTTGLWVTAIIGWAEDIVEVIMTSGNEIMLIGLIIPLAFLGVNMLRKLLRF